MPSEAAPDSIARERNESNHGKTMREGFSCMRLSALTGVKGFPNF